MLGDLYRNLRALSPPRTPHRCRTVPGIGPGYGYAAPPKRA